MHSGQMTVHCWSIAGRTRPWVCGPLHAPRARFARDQDPKRRVLARAVSAHGALAGAQPPCHGARTLPPMPSTTKPAIMMHATPPGRAVQAPHPGSPPVGGIPTGGVVRHTPGHPSHGPGSASPVPPSHPPSNLRLRGAPPAASRAPLAMQVRRAAGCRPMSERCQDYSTGLGSIPTLPIMSCSGLQGGPGRVRPGGQARREACAVRCSFSESSGSPAAAPAPESEAAGQRSCRIINRGRQCALGCGVAAW